MCGCEGHRDGNSAGSWFEVLVIGLLVLVTAAAGVVVVAAVVTGV